MAVPGVHEFVANAWAQLGYRLVSSAVPVHVASVGCQQSGVAKVIAKVHGLVSAALTEAVSAGRNATVAERATYVCVQPDGQAAVLSVAASKSHASPFV
eukprot:COSAG02_NODE_5957_length_3913_cov_50.745674_1_plen_98_part_10